MNEARLRVLSQPLKTVFQEDMNILGAIFIFTVTFKVVAAQFLQTAEVQVLLGESVILPCNGSGFYVNELQVHWEAMGKDVISLSGSDLVIGRGFDERVNFLSDPARTHDFSLILSDVMLNDGEIYECLWEGNKPICSVLLHVLTPEFFSSQIESFEGDEVTLDCFGNIPKNKPWEDIYIQWIKDDREILRLSSGQTDVMIDYSVIALPSQHDISRGIFSLTVRSVSVFDQGVYQCRYKSTDYEEPRSGFPESHTLTVWAVLSGVTDVTQSLSSSSESSHPYTSSSVPTWTAVASAQTEAGRTAPAYAYATSAQTEINNTLPTHTYAGSTQTETSSTEPAHTHTHTESIRSSTHTQIHTHSQTAEDAGLETSRSAASSPDPGLRDALELVSDERIPWIRIGLIGGVLLLTAVVLGSLLLLGRI